MSDLIERLRYKYADILHLEAADEIEHLTAENEVLREDNLTLMATNAEQFKDIERLTAYNATYSESDGLQIFNESVETRQEDEHD